LNTLDPKSFDNIQDFFIKFKSLILSLGECGINKSTQQKQLILTILAKLGPEYAVYVFNFHFGRCRFGTNWKMPTLAQFIESLTQEKKKLIHMGLMKYPKHMHSPCMMEKGHPKRMRRRDIPNPLTILQVPKTLHIPRRRRREINALIAINRIMKNPHA
jgi:hypothetical protein